MIDSHLLSFLVVHALACSVYAGEVSALYADLDLFFEKIVISNACLILQSRARSAFLAAFVLQRLQGGEYTASRGNLMRIAPMNQSQRDKVALHAQTFRSSCPDEQAAGAFDKLFSKELATWLVKRDTFFAKQSALNACKAASTAADKELESKARLWMATLLDEQGYSLVLELKPLMGATLAAVLRMPHSTELAKLNELFIKLDAYPHLHGDVQKLEAFKAATEAMRLAYQQEYNAAAAFKTASRDHMAATKVFCTAYSKMRRAMQLILGDDAVNAAFPKFAESNSTVDADAADNAEDASDAPKSSDNGGDSGESEDA